jgi:hypothetical protein
VCPQRRRVRHTVHDHRERVACIHPTRKRRVNHVQPEASPRRSAFRIIPQTSSRRGGHRPAQPNHSPKPPSVLLAAGAARGEARPQALARGPRAEPGLRRALRRAERRRWRRASRRRSSGRLPPTPRCCAGDRSSQAASVPGMSRPVTTSRDRSRQAARRALGSARESRSGKLGVPNSRGSELSARVMKHG